MARHTSDLSGMGRSTALLLSVLLLSTVLPLISGEAVDAGPGASIRRTEGRNEDINWLILVYMAGDNDLGRDEYEYGNALKMDLEEMESTIPGSGTKVLALTDQEGPGNSALYDIVQDDSPGIVSTSIPLQELDPNWTDELDMADGQTLTTFIVHCLSSYPAVHTALIIWDHGSGWYFKGGTDIEGGPRGFALDQSSGYRQMYLDDLRAALYRADMGVGGLNMDLIAFDTCFMGMVEVFYQVSPWFDIAVGSPDEEPFYGYNYTFISALSSPLTPEGLGSAMVESFKEEYINTSYSYPAIGVVDLEVLKGPFVQGLDGLSDQLLTRMYYLEVVRGGKFSAVVSRTESVGSENLDVGDMLKELALSDLGKNVTMAAQTCLDLYPGLVLDRWVKENGRNPDGTGLCIYLPYKGLLYKSIYDGSSGFLDLSMDTSWDEMIREYQKPLERVRLELEPIALDVDGIRNDLYIRALDPQASLSPIEGAAVHIDGVFQGRTDVQGLYVAKDLASGTYLVEVYNGTNVGIGSARVMNRAPIPSLEPADPWTVEGATLLLDASASMDPDGDMLLFEWDLDHTDGLGDVDSIEVMVMFPERDEGTYPISLRVFDGLEKVELVVNVTVLNGPPVARMKVPSEAVEDEVFSISANGSYDHPSDLSSLEFRFFQGGTTLTDWGSTSELDHSIPSSGYHEIRVEVRDASGAVSNDSSVIRVRNLAPIPVITGPVSAYEDEQVLFSAEGSMDTASDRASLSFAWRSGSEETFSRTGPSLNVSFSRQGEQMIWLRVTDDDGAAAETSIELLVTNMAPKASFEWPLSVLEDEVFVLNASSSSDTATDMGSLNYSWDVWNDGTYDIFGRLAAHSLPVQGEYHISLRVLDDDGAASFMVGKVNVLNSAPSPNISAQETVDEDRPVVINSIGPWDTPYDDGLLECTWWVDGKRAGTGRTPPVIVFTTEGEHRIVVEAMDDQGAIGRTEVKVSVRNPHPIAEISGTRPRIKDDQRLRLSGAGSKDTVSDQGNLTYLWYLDRALISESGPDVTLGPFEAGTHLITLRVTDDEGAWGEVNASLIVERRLDIGRVMEFVLTPLGLAVLLLLVVIAMGFGTVGALRSRGLQPPMMDDPEQGSALGAEVSPPPPDPSMIVAGEVPEDVPPRSIGEGPGPTRPSEVPPLEVPPVSNDLFTVELPPPPEIEGLPEPDMTFGAPEPNDIGGKVDT